MRGIMLWYLVASLITFIVYALDKQASKRRADRVSERALLLFDLLGGWPGGWLAQEYLRHKTKKHSFKLLFRLSIATNLALLGALLLLKSRLLG